MKFKVKFKCERCGEVYYNYVIAKSRKDITGYKRKFRNNNSLIHDIFEGGCNYVKMANLMEE